MHFLFLTSIHLLICKTAHSSVYLSIPLHNWLCVCLCFCVPVYILHLTWCRLISVLVNNLVLVLTITGVHCTLILIKMYYCSGKQSEQKSQNLSLPNQLLTYCSLGKLKFIKYYLQYQVKSNVLWQMQAKEA